MLQVAVRSLPPEIQPTLFKCILSRSTAQLLSVLFFSVQEQIGKMDGKNKPYMIHECICDEREFTIYRIV